MHEQEIESYCKMIAELDTLSNKSKDNKYKAWINECIKRLFVLLVKENYTKFSFAGSSIIMFWSGNQYSISSLEMEQLLKDFESLSEEPKEDYSLIDGSAIQNILLKKSTPSTSEQNKSKVVQVSVADMIKKSNRNNIQELEMDNSKENESPEVQSDVKYVENDGATNQPRENETSQSQDLSIKRNNLLIDLYHYSIKDKETEDAISFDMKVIPMSKIEEGACPIIVYTNYEDEIMCSCTDGTSTTTSVTVNIAGFDFIVRGDWENSAFISTIYPASELTGPQFDVTCDLQQKRPDDINSNGYIRTEFSDNDYHADILIIPLSIKNTINEATPYVLGTAIRDKSDNTYTYHVYHNTEKDYKNQYPFVIFGNNKSVSAHWNKGDFIAEIE